MEFVRRHVRCSSSLMRASDYFFKDLRYKVKKTYVPGRDYEKKTVLANVIETVPLEANCYSGVGGGELNQVCGQHL